MGADGTFVVAGGGLAGAKAVEGLRAEGFRGRIVLLCAEPHLPYERPPLSKGYLLGSDLLDSAFVHARQWYDDQGVELRLGTRAASLDLESHTILAGDERLCYDKLLLATGSVVRRLRLADWSGGSVTYLRTIEDSDRIKNCLDAGARIAIVGGGWIGLEVAAAARAAGCEVVVVEALSKPLVQVLGPEVADVFVSLHEERGVDLRTDAALTAVQERGGRVDVHLADGSSVTADLVVVGVGVSPETALAQEAGLAVENGVVVDELLRTSHPDVFAAGDVANAYHPRLGRRLRVEHWDNAVGQGLGAARNMLGAEEPYERLPYFYTDQYDLGMEFLGSIGPDGYDEVVVRGDVPARMFTAFWVKDGGVVAGMHVNDWDAMEAVRSVVEARVVDVTVLRDPDVPLAEALR